MVSAAQLVQGTQHEVLITHLGWPDWKQVTLWGCRLLPWDLTTFSQGDQLQLGVVVTVRASTCPGARASEPSYAGMG